MNNPEFDGRLSECLLWSRLSPYEQLRDQLDDSVSAQLDARLYGPLEVIFDDNLYTGLFCLLLAHVTRS